MTLKLSKVLNLVITAAAKQTLILHIIQLMHSFEVNISMMFNEARVD